jgi:hypothetical protein
MTSLIGVRAGAEAPARRCLACDRVLDGDRRRLYCGAACKMRRVRELAALAAGKRWQTACRHCGTGLTGRYRGRMYCSGTCKVAAFRARRRADRIG